MAFFRRLKQGQHYAKTWPLVDRLGMIFPENRIIKTTAFAQKFMPFLAVFSIVWQQIYAHQSQSALAIAVLTALFALCLPLQGLYWLGKRAETTLPKPIEGWFENISHQLAQRGETLSPIQHKPTYQDLARLLRQAKQKLGAEFWQEI